MTICETWGILAKKFKDKVAQNAKAQSKHVPKLRTALPDYLFRDWAYYTFPHKESTVVAELFCNGFLRKNLQCGVEFWCSDSLFEDSEVKYLRDLCANANKILECRDKGYFSALVNGSFSVFLLYNCTLKLEDIVTQVRRLLKVNGKAVVAFRDRQLKLCGVLSSFGIAAGNRITIDFS